MTGASDPASGGLTPSSGHDIHRRSIFAHESSCGGSPMASDTASTENKRKRNHKNGGRKRKNKESKHSTPSAKELFAGMGDPGQDPPAR
jgi:hypothetical protein